MTSIVPSLTPPVVVVPGITASVLRDEYDLPPSRVWSTVATRSFARVSLHPQDLRYEAQEPARVTPSHPFPLIYEDLIEELRDGLPRVRSETVPVYPFAYDWRAPLSVTEARLAAFVQEVIDRTRLLPHYYRDAAFRKAPKVDLVAHSMGGLILAGYVQASHGRFVRKVVTLATPFQGSYEAVLKIATGTAEIGDNSRGARERRMARVTPALYHLLPSFEGALSSIPDGLPASLFDCEVWQPGVVKSIADYIDQWGLPTEDSLQAAKGILRTMLDDARSHRARVQSLDLKAIGLEEDWLAVLGANARTRVDLEIERDKHNDPRFNLESSARRNSWDAPKDKKKEAQGTYDTGDGTVPLRGALPTFLDKSKLVCVVPSDFGYWEWRDRAVGATSSFHGAIPTMNMVHRLVLRFLLDAPDRHGNTWGKRVPGVKDWRPPVSPLKEE